jgi:predicted XRE-type DNA-binding protein
MDTITSILKAQGFTVIPIPGCKEYLVTTTGTVYNTRGMRLNPYVSNGYKCIKIKDDSGKRRTFLVHRLVLGEPPFPKAWVNHKDGDKANNHIDNLEWVTPSQNHLHAKDSLGRCYAKNEEVRTAKLNKTSVEAIKVLSQAGWSQSKIAEAFGVSQPTVNNALNKKTWKN